ncbi:Fic family protein [Corynebacterium sp. HMSC28B08]|uniref:Fic family protein n=1 Tax=Corynebacterium sp. HMSC28B08 TaxID=1581066 RepID=UPI0008A4C3C3|nr:Fic family protein [Corynebacterium sp. HMSC28B08]OFT86832.1 hypothetical protein HMPREF3098_10570 [Corynebacterium sp. HMSC28B08]
MAHKTDEAPRNHFNETDLTVLDELAGQLATQRLAELENAEPLSSFTAADHWGEMTIVRPFRDGNSRTQRFFFDQMMRSAG